MPNLTLASYANYALYAAMAVLALAMIAFAIYVALSMPAARARNEANALTDRGEVGDLREGERPESANRVERELVGVGSRAGTSAAVTTSPGAGAAATTGGFGRGVRSTSATYDPAAELAGELPETPRARRAAGVGMSLTWLTTLLLVASIVMRSTAVMRAPVGNMFEFAVFGAMLCLLVYLVLSLKYPLRWLGLFVVTPVLLTLGLAITVWYTDASELMPSLKSVWIAIHVPIAVLAVAIFTISFAVLLLQFAQARREAMDTPPTRGPMAFLANLPSAATLDRVAYGLNIVAFPLWTFSLIAGAIWAQQAWGSYWNWDPKEVWTFVVWTIYAAYLHARATSGWSMRTANILACLGYLSIIVNFTIINMYAVGQHSYSGL